MSQLVVWLLVAYLILAGESCCIVVLSSATGTGTSVERLSPPEVSAGQIRASGYGLKVQLSGGARFREGLSVRGLANTPTTTAAEVDIQIWSDVSPAVEPKGLNAFLLPAASSDPADATSPSSSTVHHHHPFVSVLAFEQNRTIVLLQFGPAAEFATYTRETVTVQFLPSGVVDHTDNNATTASAGSAGPPMSTEHTEEVGSNSVSFVVLEMEHVELMPVFQRKVVGLLFSLLALVDGSCLFLGSVTLPAKVMSLLWLPAAECPLPSPLNRGLWWNEQLYPSVTIAGGSETKLADSAAVVASNALGIGTFLAIHFVIAIVKWVHRWRGAYGKDSLLKEAAVVRYPAMGIVCVFFWYQGITQNAFRVMLYSPSLFLRTGLGISFIAFSMGLPVVLGAVLILDFKCIWTKRRNNAITVSTAATCTSNSSTSPATAAPHQQQQHLTSSTSPAAPHQQHLTSSTSPAAPPVLAREKEEKGDDDNVGSKGEGREANGETQSGCHHHCQRYFYLWKQTIERFLSSFFCAGRGTYRHPTNRYFVRHWGLLFEELKPSRRWYFVVDLVLTGLLAVLEGLDDWQEGDCTAKQGWVMALFLLQALLSVFLRPFHRPFHNVFHVLYCSVLWLVALLVYLGSGSATKYWGLTVATVLLVALLLVFLMKVAVNALLRFQALAVVFRRLSRRWHRAGEEEVEEEEESDLECTSGLGKAVDDPSRFDLQLADVSRLHGSPQTSQQDRSETAKAILLRVSSAVISHQQTRALPLDHARSSNRLQVPLLTAAKNGETPLLNSNEKTHHHWRRQEGGDTGGPVPVVSGGQSAGVCQIDDELDGVQCVVDRSLSTRRQEAARQRRTECDSSFVGLEDAHTDDADDEYYNQLSPSQKALYDGL